MERKIEEQLVQELEESKKEKDNNDINKEDITNKEIKEHYTLNIIQESKTIKDPTYENFNRDENSIKIMKAKKSKKYKLLI